MSSHVPIRKVLLGFLVASLIIRLLFIFSKDQPPVMWDARIYSSCAVGLLDYVENGGTYGHPERYQAADSLIDRAEFVTAMQKYIKGEWIEWLYYSQPNLAQAQEYIFLSGPVYPALLAAVFATNVGTDFEIVRVINCIVDSISAVLMMMIAVRLFGRKIAILAGILYAVYLPFIMQCGVITPDLLTTFLILLTLLLILEFYEKKKPLYLYLTGMCLGLLALNKPTASLLFVPFIAGFLYDQRDNIKGALISILKAAVPFAIVLIPWAVISTSYYGQLSIRDPEYSGANFRSSSSIKYEGYDLDYTEPDFWTYPVGHMILEDPVGYAHLLVKKFNRLWQKPYNDFKESFVIGPGLSRGFHFVIVLAGLFGVFYCFFRRKRGYLYLFLIPAYYTIVHMIFHSLPRYNLNAMPLMILAAAVVFIAIYRYIKDRKDNGRVLVITAIMIFAFILPVSFDAETTGGMTGAVMMIALKIILLVSGLYVLYVLIMPLFEKARARNLILWPGVILTVGLLVAVSASDSWAEWKVRLDRPGQKAGIRIYVPDDIRLVDGELFRIGIDITALRDKYDLFYVTLNGEKVGFLAGAKPLTDYYYPKFGYTVFERMLDIPKVEMRSWSFISMDPQAFNYMLDRDGYIGIELECSDSLAADGGYIDFYGGYKTAAKNHLYLPGTHYSSAERLLDKGDPRIWLDYKLSSDSAISYYIDGKTEMRPTRDDLSDAFGRQRGRYHVIVEIKRLDKNRNYF